MKPGLITLALVAMITAAWLSHARAAPPTVTPSPGYDARLQEERARNAASQPAATGGSTAPVVGHHVKKVHRRTH
jgi:hypothetical protein